MGIVVFILVAPFSSWQWGEVGVGMLGFLTDFLWTFSVDKVFMTLGNFSLMILLLVGTCLLFITSFPVYALSGVSSTLLSPVQMVVGPLLRSPLAIHVRLVICLLERMTSELSMSSEDGNSNGDVVESGGCLLYTSDAADE